MRLRSLLSCGAVAAALVASPAIAQNLLVNGGIDAPLLVDTWTLDETVTGLPAAVVDSAAIQDFANQPTGATGQAGLWLRAFAGNIGDFNAQNRAINAVLSQSVAGTAGETYTLTGWSRWETNFSGGAPTLAAGSPSGAVPSPTDSTFEIAFLNAGNSVLSTASLDLRSVQMNDGNWRQHTLAAAAPAGTTSVRVTASALDMVFNTDPGQSGFYDNFSLTRASLPAVELLGNAALNAPLQVPGFQLLESPSGADTASIEGFADRTGDGTGVWLRPFVTQIPEGDATLTQTVDGIAGQAYTFSAWSRWEANYSGGQTGSPTQTLMQMTFLDGMGAAIGSPLQLDLRTQQSNDAVWRQHLLSGIAPVGTDSVRIAAIANDMFATSGSQSAFFDDLSLTTAVPEPASIGLALMGAATLACLARRRASN